MGCSSATSITTNIPSYSAPSPSPPTNIGVQWSTPTNAQTVSGTLSWTPSQGATSYTVDLGNGPQTVANPPISITGVPGSQITISIKACN
jgi:hypothetical protein